jgi:hypothetical protein
VSRTPSDPVHTGVGRGPFVSARLPLYGPRGT